MTMIKHDDWICVPLLKFPVFNKIDGRVEYQYDPVMLVYTISFQCKLLISKLEGHILIFSSVTSLYIYLVLRSCTSLPYILYNLLRSCPLVSTHLYETVSTISYKHTCLMQKSDKMPYKPVSLLIVHSNRPNGKD